MKIIKYSSPGDIERVAKYMINVMAASRIFDDEGNYLNPESASGFPVFNINDVEYSMKASAGFIYHSENVCNKTFGATTDTLTEFVRLLTETILTLENQYNLHKLPWYNNRYRTVFNSAQTCIKIKPTISNVGNQEVSKKNAKTKKRENRLMENFHTITNNKYISREAGAAKFTWHLMSVAEDHEVVGYYPKNESLLQKHISSIFLDADDSIVLADRTFVPLLQHEHFTAQTNTITAENITVSPYGNPLMFYLNLEWRNAYDIFKRISYSCNKGSYMFRKLLSPVYEVVYDASVFAGGKSEILSCNNCRSMLFDDIYILKGRKIYTEQKLNNNVDNNARGNIESNICDDLDANYTIDNNQQLMLCPLCLHLSLYPFECEYKYTLRTKIPVSAHDVIEFSVAPKPHKEALHVLAELTPKDVEQFNHNESGILELGEHNSSNGYVIANMTNRVYYAHNDHNSIMKKSGYGGKKIIKVKFLH